VAGNNWWEKMAQKVLTTHKCNATLQKEMHWSSRKIPQMTTLFLSLSIVKVAVAPLNTIQSY